MESQIPIKVNSIDNAEQKNCEEKHENVDFSILQEEYLDEVPNKEKQLNLMTQELQKTNEKISRYELLIEQLKSSLTQKDNVISLYEREKIILEKEKDALKKQTDSAIREKENIVISFANKEKALIDAKKDTEHNEKLLLEAKKEIKNISSKYQTVNEEKSRIQHMIDDKLIEIKKQQKENDKLRNEVLNLENKLKINTLKFNQEIDARIALEKKIEEERAAPRAEEKNIEQKRIENEASLILLKHELDTKDKHLESVRRENKHYSDKILNLQDNLSKEIFEKTSLSSELNKLKLEHTSIQNSLSKEMLASAKLRGQLEELNVLQTRNIINEEKISNLNETIFELEEKLKDCAQEIEHLRNKEAEFLGVNKEMSAKIADLQNHILLQNSKVLACETECEIIRKEKLVFDEKYDALKSNLNKEIEHRNEERLLLTKHLSEKTKLYEGVKIKLEDAMGDLEATKKKHSQIFKELNREIHKYKKLFEEKCSYLDGEKSTEKTSIIEKTNVSTSKEDLNYYENQNPTSCSSNQSQHSDSESDIQSNSSIGQLPMEPSKEYLVSRILKLQKAVARQTEKIDFLENHTMQLVAELQKKSKLIQYYMLRDQVGALTTTKSDQNKTEFAKYGGVMSAIYSGIKGANQTSMTLELSLEINKKLQAVLEDTLLKNITLKENLDVLGLEVDKLTREMQKLRK